MNIIDTSQQINPRKVTNNLHNNQLIYFTSTSLLSNDNQLIFLSERNGNPNIFLLDLASGVETQLTNNNEGYLKSYVYFDGKPYRGFGKASISVHPGTGKIYFIQGKQICVTDTFGNVKVLAEYPAGQMTAFTHISLDGTLLCVPTTDERALDGNKQLNGKPDYDIDERVRKEKLCSYLHIYDTRTGEKIICEKVPEAWITHVQFSPIDNDLILYNNEWPSDCGIRRMWIWNRISHTALRTEGDGRKKEDWTCHEMWERDGSAIIYHGAYKDGPAYVGRVKPDGTDRSEISFPEGWTRYGHFTEGKPGMLVTDGYFDDRTESSALNNKAKDPSIDIGLKKSEISGEWISLLKVDWDKQSINWIPLCRHNSSWESQDCHPHPIFNHKADKIFFTSDNDGIRSIYCINISDIK